MIYRKKPVEIEAWEFTREALKSNDSWVRLYENELHLISQYAGEVIYIEIDTLEGTMRANLGDFIIKGVQGEFYPCKPDIFEQTYEKGEQEKLYTVEIEGVGSSRLFKNTRTNEYLFSSGFHRGKKLVFWYTDKLTEQEIKKVDERLWEFAKPVEDK